MNGTVRERIGRYRERLAGKKIPWGILLAAGLILAAAWPFPSAKKTGAGEQAAEEQNAAGERAAAEMTYEEKLESKLARILSGVKGAGRVEVMITLESSAELVLQTDGSEKAENLHEEDSAGGLRDSTSSESSRSTVQAGQDGEPYVVKEINPRVSGVIVVAEGAGSASVKNEICEAVEALFGLPAHKIKVLEAK